MLGSLIPPGLRAGGWWWHQELGRQAAPLSTCGLCVRRWGCRVEKIALLVCSSLKPSEPCIFLVLDSRVVFNAAGIGHIHQNSLQSLDSLG